MSLVPSFGQLLQSFSTCFTKPSFATFVTVLSGWVFARRHTVTGGIVAADSAADKHHSAYHRFFAAARWSLDAGGLVLVALLLPFCGSVAFLVLDDTLAHKHGRKMFGGGMHYDRSISSKKTVLKSWGHNWVILGLVLKVPCRKDRRFCLPILFRLYRGPATVARQGGRYFTRPQLAVQMLQVLCAAHPSRRFHALVDSAYGGQTVLKNLPDNCDLTARWLTNARLYTAPPPPPPGKKGPKRVHGEPLPSPQRMLEGRCRHRTLKLYGRQEKFRLADCRAYFYAVPQRLLHIVAVDPLRGGRKPQAFFSTATSAKAERILLWYTMRWSVEVAIHDAKGALGFEQPQGWSRQAVLRTAPMTMLLYSLIVLWFAQEGHRHYQPLPRPWYRSKPGASFADMLATLRCQSVQEGFSQTPVSEQGRQEWLKTLLHALKQAA